MGTSNNNYSILRELIEEKGKDALPEIDDAYATNKISTMEYHELIAMTE